MANLREWLNQKTDAASLAALRFLFGALLFVDVARYLRQGWVSEYYIEPAVHFTYYGFQWVKPWPGWGMYVHFLALGLGALAIAFGYFFRLATTLFVLGFGYVFLLEKAHYLNHFYVILLLAGLLATTPANRLWSLDVRRRKLPESKTIPTWPLALLRAQLVLIYVYAGVAKLNWDWLHAQPMRLWLEARANIPLLGPLIASEPSYWAASYLGLIVDLVLPFLLLFKRTRMAALGAMALFHLTNALLFSIGIFPWMMLACNLIFLDSDWPRRLPAWLQEYLVLPDLKDGPGDKDGPQVRFPTAPIVLMAGFLLVQLLLPLRHHLYPGDVAWTEEGHRFSWRMKLRDKRGHVQYTQANGPGAPRTPIDIQGELAPFQRRKTSCDPGMILQFAHHLAAKEKRKTGHAPAIFADARCRLNGHPKAPLIDPNQDLTQVELGLAPAPWILPRPKTTH